MSRIPRRVAQATVIGDADAPLQVLRAAEQIGALLASRGITVVTGGRGGVMEAASRGAVKAGGVAVGILPAARMSAANPWCTVVIPTGLGHARNALTALAGDFIVAVGGGAGTLSEICFAWIHGRRTFVLGGLGGWADRVSAAGLDHRATSSIVACPDLDSLERRVVRFCREKHLRLAPRSRQRPRSTKKRG